MRTRIVTAVLLAVAAAAVTGGLRAQPVAAADKLLLGTWVVQKAERDGAADEMLKGSKYQFADGNMTVTPADPKMEVRVATYKVIAHEKADEPMRLIFTPVNGDNKGKDYEGIIRIKDGVLDICHCGVPREKKGELVPTDFVTKTGSRFVLVSLKKS